MMAELGVNFGNGEMILGTDSSAAKSFVFGGESAG